MAWSGEGVVSVGTERSTVREKGERCSEPSPREPSGQGQEANQKLWAEAGFEKSKLWPLSDGHETEKRICWESCMSTSCGDNPEELKGAAAAASTQYTGKLKGTEDSVSRERSQLCGLWLPLSLSASKGSLVLTEGSAPVE